MLSGKISFHYFVAFEVTEKTSKGRNQPTTGIIHNQTQEFLDKNNILYKYQSGFRKITPQTLVCLTLLIKLKLALRKDYSQVWF